MTKTIRSLEEPSQEPVYPQLAEEPSQVENAEPSVTLREKEVVNP